MLLSNSSIDANQLISILSAVTSKIVKTENSTDADHMKTVKYESIASIIRECDKSQAVTDLSTLQVNNASSLRNGRYRRPFRQATPERLAEIKSKSQCRHCKKWGHWDTDHNSDG